MCFPKWVLLKGAKEPVCHAAGNHVKVAAFLILRSGMLLKGYHNLLETGSTITLSWGSNDEPVGKKTSLAEQRALSGTKEQKEIL